MMVLTQQVENLLQPVVESLGCVLWGCVYLAQGKYSVLRVYIDKADGVQVDDCERVSHEVSALLDVEDPIPGQYYLEVSSPGIPRPLLHIAHYVLYIGKKIAISLKKPWQGSRKLQACIVSVSGSQVTLQTSITALVVDFSDILKAHVVDE